jgi:hypothetical protein
VVVFSSFGGEQMGHPDQAGSVHSLIHACVEGDSMESMAITNRAGTVGF